MEKDREKREAGDVRCQMRREILLTMTEWFWESGVADPVVLLIGNILNCVHFDQVLFLYFLL